MTYDALERSNDSGAPVKLFEFQLGTTYWRYCAGQIDVVYGGYTYSAIAVSHGDIVMSGDTQSDEMSVQISSAADVTDLFSGTPPSQSLAIRIRSKHHGDSEAPVIWTGIVKSSTRTSRAEVTFLCNSLLSTLTRSGLRLSWGRGCPHVLYDGSCRVNPASYATAVQVQDMNGNTLVSTGLAMLPDAYFAGGFLSFTGPWGGTERRGIEYHVGTNIQLLSPTDGISVGDWILVYPGCDRVTLTCQSKFNNLANYGGFPHLPVKSPFDGDPVF
jgi:uncharacterized phage protein (TIGR02218 family)